MECSRRRKSCKTSSIHHLDGQDRQTECRNGWCWFTTRKRKAKEVSYVIKYEYVAPRGLQQSYMFSHNYFAPALFLRIYFSWLDDCKHDTSSAWGFFLLRTFKFQLQARSPPSPISSSTRGMLSPSSSCQPNGCRISHGWPPVCPHFPGNCQLELGAISTIIWGSMGYWNIFWIGQVDMSGGQMALPISNIELPCVASSLFKWTWGNS